MRSLRIILLILILAGLDGNAQIKLPANINNEFASILIDNYNYRYGNTKIFIFQKLQRRGIKPMDIDILVESIAENSKNRDIIFDVFKEYFGNNKENLYMNLKSIGLSATTSKYLADYIIEEKYKPTNLVSKEGNISEPKPKNISSNVSKTDSMENKVGEKIYGDFNGDGNLEYAYRVLVKKGSGNPIEEGQPDKYEIQFSDKNIKSIKEDFNWFILVNEGDLNKDASEEISVREVPMNGCIGNVYTFTIKNGKASYLLKPFSYYSGTCDNKITIDPQDLVEDENGTIYYYDYDINGILDQEGGISVNGKGKKIFGIKIKAF